MRKKEIEKEKRKEKRRERVKKRKTDWERRRTKGKKEKKEGERKSWKGEMKISANLVLKHVKLTTTYSLHFYDQLLIFDQVIYDQVLALLK